MPHPNVVLVNRLWECLLNIAGYGDGTQQATMSPEESLQVLRDEVLTPDFTYYMPGHHPLSGIKHGVDEVASFFSIMVERTDLLQNDQTITPFGEDGAVEVHHAYSARGGVNGAFLDIYNCFIYRIRGGKLAEIRVFNNAQHDVDNYFSAIYRYKPIPNNLAD